MTTDNTTEDMVDCEDGETRPRSLCCETHDGRWYPSGEVVSMGDGTVVHPRDSDVCYCDDDDAYYWIDDCVVVRGRWVHQDDATTCDCCGRGMYLDDANITPGDESYCRWCFDTHCVSCDRCGDTQWMDDNTLDEEGYCESCAESRAPRLIAAYSDKSANTLPSETKSKERYGVELEVEGYETAAEAAEYIRQFLPANYCVLKRDGSLGEAGVEIVTRPDSMAVHKRMFAALFADSPGRALSSWTNGRCGMHVHISRAALSQLQIGKMLCFLNEPAAVNFVSKIAGRKPCHWCKVHKKKVSDCKHDSDRYSALNLTNRNTVEIRIFKGTLKDAGFYKNLEFVQALVEFTAPASRSIAQATSYRAFCEWLPKKAYPHLYAFLSERGFIRRRHAA
jgi:hypothetical protein